MARRKSNQRITKIKKDYILDLLQRAEATSIENACSVQPAGSDLTPYPDLNNLRLWTRDYLLKGVTKLFPVNVDENGQTYYTCLIDGLPLHTKLTKQISASRNYYQPFINIIGNPSVDSSGVSTNFNNSNYYTITDSSIIGVSNRQIYFNYTIPSNLNSPLKVLEIQFPNTTWTVSTSDGSNFTISDGSNTSSDTWTDLDKGITFYTTLYNNVYSATCVNYGSFLTTSNLTQPSGFPQAIIFCQTETYTTGTSFDFNESYVSVTSSNRLYFWGEQPGVETSKPGLWLSNLIVPVSNSVAGSYLKHNFIHDYSGSFNTVNSDVIGNYSYSYFQRGIIHRTAGSTHDDNDSYCQHWSPSALSCISHDAIIIPLNNLRSTYTSYQTYVVPSDPNMQRYDETPSKDVEFYFVDNNNNVPLTTTHFNGRVVGDGWTYELVFEPNGNGSENDYGEGDDPTVPNGSNGGCITGTISYQDSVLGTNCVQEVNSCFQTNQSYFNPLVPEIPSNNLLDDPTIQNKVYKGLWTAYKCCCTGIRVTDTFAIRGTFYGKLTGAPYHFTNPHPTIEDAYQLYYDISASATCGIVGLEGVSIDDSDACSGLCGNLAATGNYVFMKATEDGMPTSNGVNIYINVIDLKKQSESEGVPWNDNACGNARFSFTFSTEPCEESYCTSLVIATNVDINQLGDISKLDHVELSNIA